MFDVHRSTAEQRINKDFSEIHFVLDYSKIEDQISLSKEGTTALQVVAYLENKDGVEVPKVGKNIIYHYKNGVYESVQNWLSK